MLNLCNKNKTMKYIVTFDPQRISKEKASPFMVSAVCVLVRGDSNSEINNNKEKG